MASPSGAFNQGSLGELMAQAEFFEAAKEGNSEKLRSLLAAHPSLLSYRGAGTADAVLGNSAVHWAAAKGRVEALSVLLASGGDVHARNKGDSTPLSSAVTNGHATCVRLLLEARASPLEEDDAQPPWFSLHVACASSHPECAALLIAARAPVRLSLIHI